MRNYVQKGDVLPFTAPADGVVGGNGYLIGALFVVAAVTEKEGETFSGHATGVFELPAVSGASTDWAEGAAIYWDNTNKRCTKTATDNTLIGHAVTAKAVGDTVAVVRLRG